jgi:colanic acid/amylovoran biosynthesis glycosyltransferase
MSASRRHIGYVLKRFPRISETFVAAELIELERQGEHVTVFALARPDEPFAHDFVRELRATVVYLPNRPLRQPLRVAFALDRCIRRAPRAWLAAARISLWPPRLVGLRRLLQACVLRDELARARIDHVHAHFATAAARLANLAWRMGGPSYSVTAHAKDIYHREVRLDHLRDKLAPASFVATVTQANRAYLATVLGDPSHVHHVPNSVDLHRIPRERRPEPGLVLAVARQVEKKGLDDLVAAAAILVARGVPLRLELVGDGPLRPTLERAVRVSGVEAVFHGPLPHERVLELYRHAAVFCLPCVVASTGDRDGLPTSLLEALASGVPVVATAVNGLAEVVLHERTGLVVPEHDPDALALALERVLTDTSLAERLGNAGRRQVEQGFSLARSAALLRSLFPEAA